MQYSDTPTGGNVNEDFQLYQQNIRALKGAALSVFFCLWANDGFIRQPTIERRTAFSDKPVRQALHLLHTEYGLVNQDQDDKCLWQIAPQVKAHQMPDLLARLDLRAFKGAPLAVLACIVFAGKAATVGQEWCERFTGYTDKTVSQALTWLQEMNYLTHTSAGWQLVSAAVQLPLSAKPLPQPDLSRRISADHRNFSDSLLADESENFRSEASLTTIDLVAQQVHAPTRVGESPLITGISPTQEPPEGNNSGNHRNFSDSKSIYCSGSGSSNINSIEPTTTTNTPADESENLRLPPALFRLHLAELKRFGIGGPQARHIAGLPHVNLRLIRYHCQYSGIKTGQMIARIRDDWGVPMSWADPDEAQPEMPAPAVLDGPEDPACEPATILDPAAVKIWRSVLNQLQMGELRRVDFTTWVDPLQLVSFDGETLTVAACNTYGRDWVETRLGKTIENLLIGVVGHPVAFVVIVS